MAPGGGEGGCQGSIGLIRVHQRSAGVGDSFGSVGVHWGNFGVNQGFIGGLSKKSLLGVYQ